MKALAVNGSSYDKVFNKFAPFMLNLCLLNVPFGVASACSTNFLHAFAM
jgi:hypothetical protein